MKKFYSIKGQDSDECYDLVYFQEILKDDDHSNKYVLEVWEANIPGDGTFYCKEDGECYDSSESYCGSQCQSYKPRNGKSGCCIHHGPTYSPTGQTVTIEK